MSSYDIFTDHWLESVLRDLGDSPEAVADTLRRAKIKGLQRKAEDCPIARYIAMRVRQCAPEAQVRVTVESVVDVELAVPDVGYCGYLVASSPPEPVVEFLERFDDEAHAGNPYPDLVAASET